MADTLTKAVPQFVVVTAADGVAFGSEVYFKGQAIANVMSVSVETTLTVEDVARSRIIIELTGEPIELRIK